MSDAAPRLSAFAAGRLIASGPPAPTIAAARAHRAASGETIVFFDDVAGQVVDIDERARSEAGRPEAAPPDARADDAPRGRGRPKLGVVAREVTLLPRHWDWLAAQPGGASVALRKLVEAARRDGAEADRIRRAREAAYRFMTALAGDRPGYEAAIRALFAGDAAGLEAAARGWPADLTRHIRSLLER